MVKARRGVVSALLVVLSGCFGHILDMATLTFDTYKFIERLVQEGIPEQQARAIADGLRDIELNHVATREDIASVRLEIVQAKTELIRWFVPLLLGQAALIVTLIKFL